MTLRCHFTNTNNKFNVSQNISPSHSPQLTDEEGDPTTQQQTEKESSDCPIPVFHGESHLIIADHVRSTSVGNVFHRCLSVHRRGEGQSMNH